MAETALVKTVVQDKYAQTGVVITMAAADVANDNSIVQDRDILVLAHNTGATQRNITVTSTALPGSGRTGDFADTIEAGEIMAIRLTAVGWANSSGLIILSADHAEVEFGVVTL